MAAASDDPPVKRKRKKGADAALSPSGAATPEASGAAADAPKRGKAADKEAASRVDDEEDDKAEGLDSLLRLRSLLAPAAAAPRSVAAGAGADGAAAASATGGDGDGGASAPGLRGPDWTSRYHVVRASDPPTPLEELPRRLHPALERALRKAGFTAVFPIQAAVVPLLSRSAEATFDDDSPHCCDVCVAAPTGQGKTLAYAAPIVQALLGRAAPRVRALVLLPTRDLAMQVFRVFEMLRCGLGAGVAQVRAVCLVGQRSFAEESRSLVQQPPDIVICTPGRLADHYLGRQGRLDLSALRWFVADEADRLLSQGYNRWLEILDRVCGVGGGAPAGDAGVPGGSAPSAAPTLGRSRPPQKLLLSATMTWNPQKLAMLRLRRPLFFFSSLSGQHATPAELQQYTLKCKQAAKPLALLHILARMLRGELDGAGGGGAEKARAVVFCPSVDTAHRLARLLQICVALAEDSPGDATGEAGDEDADGASGDGAGGGGASATWDIPPVLRVPGAIAEFSSTLAQRERTALLGRFRRAEVRCLVCSDVVARGIDIPEVSAVINYSAPTHLQTYIHRVGRTARAGRRGHTFTFVKRTDMARFEAMLRESADCWERIRKYSLPREARDTELAWYAESLGALSRCFAEEETGRLKASVPLAHRDLPALGVAATAAAVAAAPAVAAGTPTEAPEANRRPKRRRASSGEAGDAGGPTSKEAPDSGGEGTAGDDVDAAMDVPASDDAGEGEDSDLGDEGAVETSRTGRGAATAAAPAAAVGAFAGFRTGGPGSLLSFLRQGAAGRAAAVGALPAGRKGA